MVVQGSTGSFSLRPRVSFNGVKVFSATMFADRSVLGEKVTAWMAEHAHLQIVEMTVTQSSDASFHCITITLFYREPARPAA